MSSRFTEIRQAVEALFANVDVKKIITFNTRHGAKFDDPALDVADWIRVDPMGGPTNSHYSGASWLITRKFRVLLSLPMGVLDVGELEAIEQAVFGCVAAGVRDGLGLDYVRDVRWRGTEYALFERADRKDKRSEGTETWIGMGEVEVDYQELRSEIVKWAPTEP